MTSPIALPGRPKDVLVRGAVRPWHVIFILLVAYVVSQISALKLTQGLDSALRDQLLWVLGSSINALICLAFVVVVPEFRRALRSAVLHVPHRARSRLTFRRRSS